MKKNGWVIIIFLTGIITVLFFKGCSSYNAVSYYMKNPLEDSVKFSGSDSIKFIGVGSRNNIPIVKLYLGFYGRKYFIVDTGATFSIIDSTWIFDHNNLIEYIRKIDFIRLQSFSEKTSRDVSYTIRLPINGVAHDFLMLDIKSLREKINLTGYNIIGIIGSDFLSKHKYIIDYNKQYIYKPPIKQQNKLPSKE
ncbi:hypothetical protein [uncultured Bacteroides sp.]|uniref:hypothetical protein n=1 Tax=uncultured Bacteroides sp. TaxID=162156 RepID=UPI002AABEA18|nr:hypothetical protein [uncultured Bacteroides sp.]